MRFLSLHLCVSISSFECLVARVELSKEFLRHTPRRKIASYAPKTVASGIVAPVGERARAHAAVARRSEEWVMTL